MVIDDIRNPSRNSGFDYVNRAGRTNERHGNVQYLWRARLGKTDAERGPARQTPEEAAQDYVEHINNMKPITPDDIRNPKRKSGFNYVNIRDAADGRKNLYRAQVGVGPNPAYNKFIGPRRATAEEAAQDYCDYINGQYLKPALEPWETPEVDMGNTKRHAPKPEPVKIVRKEFKGPHDLYDVEFLAPWTKEFVVRKVGITAKGKSRYSDIARTFGFTIRPVARAITYPTKTAARAAEDQLIAKLCADPNWKRVGKEAFVPVKGTE